MKRRRLLMQAATVAFVGRIEPMPTTASSPIGGTIPVSAIPGFRLRLARAVRQPGWEGGFDGALVACVVAGELTVGLDDGYAAIWRAGADDGPNAEPLLPGDVAFIGSGDCIAADPEGASTAGSLRNLGPDAAEVWETALTPMPLARTQPCERRARTASPPSS